MPEVSDYHICITGHDDDFIPSLDKSVQLIDFLDFSYYLDGPDRETGIFVRLPHRDTQHWSQYVRTNPEEPVKYLRRRYVYLTYSPIALDQPYRHYNDLIHIIEGITPREAGFIACLGRGTRNLVDVLHCPVPGESRRWIRDVVVYLIRGYHPVWKRVFNEQESRKEWELTAVKGFNLMLVCKLDSRIDVFKLEEFIEVLRLKEEFMHFLKKIGQTLGYLHFEMLGEVSR
jgi:hypothetical protein